MSDLRPPQIIQPGTRTPPISPTGQPPKITPLGPQPPQPRPADEPISLIDDAGQGDKGSVISASSKIKLSGAGAHASHTYKRQTTTTGQGACRLRTFHGRLSDEGMAFLDDKINEWLDNHPEIEIKFVTTNIGQFEGKTRELALIVNVWY